MNEKFAPHHEDDPTQQHPAEQSWRRSAKGQALWAVAVEDLGEPSSRPPTARESMLMRGIMSACIRAHSDCQPLSDDDAQATAALLSTAIDNEHDSCLEDIAEARGIHPGSSREELRSLWMRPRLRVDARETINFLGGYILSQEHPRFTPSIPTDQESWEHHILPDEDAGQIIAVHYQRPPGISPDEALDQAQQRGRAMLHMLGDAGLAHLRRPSVDVLADEVLEQFSEEYITSATQPHLIFQRLHGTPDPEPGLNQRMELIHAGHMVHAFWRPHHQHEDTGHGA